MIHRHQRRLPPDSFPLCAFQDDTYDSPKLFRDDCTAREKVCHERVQVRGGLPHGYLYTGVELYTDVLIGCAVDAGWFIDKEADDMAHASAKIGP